MTNENNSNANPGATQGQNDDPRQAMEAGEPSITGTKRPHTGAGSEQKDDPRQANESGEPECARQQ